MLEYLKYEDNFITGIIEANENEFRMYKEEKLSEMLEKIGIEKMAIVRTTGVLPDESGKIKPSCRNAFVLKQMSGYRSAVGDILREGNEQLWNKALYDDEAYMKVKTIEDSYIPYSSQYRSTIHFTINSLVGNHANGNFDNYPYIIVEPLSRHINDEKIICIRPEDTFFQQDIELSEEAVVLMEEKEYSKISYEKRKKLAERMRIYVYNGSKEIALQKLLLNLGYYPEKVGSHGFINSETSANLEKEIKSVIEEKWGEIYFEPHSFTKVYKDDDERSLIIWEKYDRAFLEYFIKQFNLNANVIEDLLDYNGNKIMQELIREQGLDKYKKVVQTFNKAIDMKIANDRMPTNEEIILNNAEIVTDEELSIAEEIMNKNIKIKLLIN